MIFDKIIKFIFPNRCVICDTILPYGEKLENTFLCDKCRSKVEFIKEPTCKKCGAMIAEADDDYCTRCKLHMYESYEYGFGLCRYNDAVKESLHKIKYGGRKEYIDFYGRCLAKVYHKKFKEIKADCLVPVPIHSERFRIRTYNQAEVLANAISEELKKYGIDIPVNTDIIFRSKNTKVLNKLDSNSRLNELKNAFTINKAEDIEKVIIVDDIYTTGTTIDAIAKCLKDSGINRVYFTTIAVVDNL